MLVKHVERTLIVTQAFVRMAGVHGLAIQPMLTALTVLSAMLIRSCATFLPLVMHVGLLMIALQDTVWMVDVPASVMIFMVVQMGITATNQDCVPASPWEMSAAVLTIVYPDYVKRVFALDLAATTPIARMGSCATARRTSACRYR